MLKFKGKLSRFLHTALRVTVPVKFFFTNSFSQSAQGYSVILGVDVCETIAEDGCLLTSPAFLLALE